MTIKQVVDQSRTFARGEYVRPWTYLQNGYMDMTKPLRSAITHNPFLKVFVAIGYYDMATIMGGSRPQAIETTNTRTKYGQTA